MEEVKRRRNVPQVQGERALLRHLIHLHRHKCRFHLGFSLDDDHACQEQSHMPDTRSATRTITTGCGA